MVYLLYNCLLIVSSLVLVPYYLLRGLRYGKSRRGIRERLGYFTADQMALLQEKSVIWIHAVSVGETRAAIPLLRQLKESYPGHALVLSNVTETGHEIAQDLDCLDLCIFFPFDLSWVTRRALRAISPELIAIVETEIWPNFTRQANKLNIPILLVNGRLSDRSYPRYRYARYFLKPILNCFSAFCMQSQVDTERIISLGAPSRIVENTGNLKFDHVVRDLSHETVKTLKNNYGFPDDAVIVVAGSTHEGEEKILLEAFEHVVKTLGTKIYLILIPRHPERKKDIPGIFKNISFRCRFRSELTSDSPKLTCDEVLVVDTLGEVLSFYSIAELVFVGGSFVPVGGHNLLEASLLSKAVLFGSHIHNFKEISKKLVHAGGGIMVHNAAELEDLIVRLLSDSVRRRAMGAAGRALIAENTGATERTLKHIQRVMK